MTFEVRYSYGQRIERGRQPRRKSRATGEALLKLARQSSEISNSVLRTMVKTMVVTMIKLVVMTIVMTVVIPMVWTVIFTMVTSMAEAMVMTAIGAHPNVICLVGVVTSGNPKLMVIEFCQNGERHRRAARNGKSGGCGARQFRFR